MFYIFAGFFTFPSIAGACTAESGFWGVSKCGKRWQVNVRPIGKPQLSLGPFDSPTDAAIVYDAKVLKLNLEQKRPLNFEWSSAAQAATRAGEVLKSEKTRVAEAKRARKTAKTKPVKRASATQLEDSTVLPQDQASVLRNTGALLPSA